MALVMLCALCVPFATTASAALSNGDRLQLWDESTSGAKVYTIKYDEATDAYIIMAKQSGLVLDVEGGSTADGAKVWQWEDLGGLNQRWRFEKAEDGYYYIHALEGKYLDVTEGKTANGTKIISFRFQKGAKNQMFKPVKISSGTSRTGSVLSDGNWWIIGGISALAVVSVGALLVVKKKKKPAAADGAGNDEEV